MKKINFVSILFCWALLGISMAVYSQVQHIIKGRVTDAVTNLPIAGATVQIKGTQKATTTDDNGNFSIDVADLRRAVLVFSNVSYGTQEIPVGKTGTLNAFLEAGSNSLNEVVVTAYVAEKKKDITGAVSVVNVAEMVKQPSALITDQLQGQAAGVTVIASGQPGIDPQIRIRGINTFGNNTPLYVVDGVPTQNIGDINSNDIASIQVLKDAGAASIYGSRASNGVIILTTKKGKGKVNVHYDGYVGTQRPKSGNVFHILNPQQQADLEWQADKNSGITPNDPLYGNGATPRLPDYIAPLGAMEGDPSVDPSLYYVNPNYTDLADYSNFYRITKANKAGTDWYHEIFKPAPMTSHNITVDGGSDRGNYLFSINYLNQQGTLIETYIKRYSIRANTTFNVTKNIHIGENLSSSITHNPTISDLQSNSPIFFTLQTPRIIPVYDIKGNYGGVYGTGLNGPNAVGLLRRTANNGNTSNRLFGNMFADIDFLKHFTFHTSFGGENYSGSAHAFNYPTYENSGNSTINSYAQSSYAGYSWTWTNTVSYHQQFGDHDIKFMAGTEAYRLYYENMGAATQNYFSFDPDYTTLSTGSGLQTNYGGRSKESLTSEFGRLDYAFKDKYLLSATLRRDGSSKFVHYQYGWFPAASLGWRISQEGFMKNISWINDLKIRGSWGVLGNQLNVNADNGYYTFVMDKSMSYYDISGSNNSNQAGFQEGQIANPDAKWEKDYTTNFGIDATLFNNKLDLTIDYYRKDIQGLLYNPSVPGTQGVAPPPYINISGVKNDGLDMAIHFHQSITKDLKLDIGANLTTYHNVISKVANDANYFWTNDQRDYGSDFIRNEVGHPIGAFYGYKIIGFWNSTDEIATADKTAKAATGTPGATFQPDEGVGRFRYADVNHDGQITDADRTFIGNPNPKYNFGFNLRATYLGFDVSFFIYGVHGNDVWNDTRHWTDFFGQYNNEAKSETALFDSWTPDNHNARAPIQEQAKYASTSAVPNSYYVEDGSYIKLKNIQLGYSLPSSLLKKAGIEKLRIYVQASNLFTITKYTGVDPEISGTVTDFGVDGGIYPNTRQFLAGISLAF